MSMVQDHCEGRKKMVEKAWPIVGLQINATPHFVLDAHINVLPQPGACF